MNSPKGHGVNVWVLKRKVKGKSFVLYSMVVIYREWLNALNCIGFVKFVVKRILIN
jgi:hypothetical protein